MYRCGVYYIYGCNSRLKLHVCGFSYLYTEVLQDCMLVHVEYSLCIGKLDSMGVCYWLFSSVGVVCSAVIG